MGSSPSNDIAALNAAQRRAHVVALRRQRLTFSEIGQQLGVSAQRAHELYAKALAAVPAAHVEEHRAEELALIDDAINDLLTIARNHKQPRTAVEAWNAIRGWADRKARLLGLDAPKQVEVHTIDAIDARLIELADEIGNDRAST